MSCACLLLQAIRSTRLFSVFSGPPRCQRQVPSIAAQQQWKQKESRWLWLTSITSNSDDGSISLFPGSSHFFFALSCPSSDSMVVLESLTMKFYGRPLQSTWLGFSVSIGPSRRTFLARPRRDHTYGVFLIISNGMLPCQIVLLLRLYRLPCFKEEYRQCFVECRMPLRPNISFPCFQHVEWYWAQLQSQNHSVPLLPWLTCL